MLTYRGIIGKREIGEKTGNGWENGKPVEGVFVCWLSFLLQGACPPSQRACPPHPPATGGAECTPTVRRMVAAWSPHGQDSALYNFCSICYNSDKERKRET